jgi:Tfp pilus assembly protein PilF
LSWAASGCAGASPWGGAEPIVAEKNKDPMAILAQFDGSKEPRFAEPSFTPPRPAGAPRTSVFGGFGGAVNSAMTKTKDALTIEPKVVRAPDPLSLTDGPRDVGPELYFASARMHESQGNTNKADELYRKALAEASNDLSILAHYARMHDRAGNLDRAVEIYRQAVTAHPQEAAAHNDLGLCLARMNRLGESIECLQQATRLQPASVLYRNNLATVLVEAGQHDEALTHLISAHGPAVGHYNLGFLLHKSGKTQQAVGYVQRALDIDPQLTPASKLLSAMTKAPQAPAPRGVGPAVSPVANTVRPNVPGAWETHSAAPPASASGPQSLPALNTGRGEDWGPAPTPNDLPQLLPPVN